MITDMNQATEKRDSHDSESEFELERIEKLYLMGDFGQARRRAKKLSSKGLTKEQQTATSNLLAATGIDPLAVVAFIVTAVALATIVVLYAN